MAVVALGGGRRLPTDAIDHAVGFDRLLGFGATVEAGHAARPHPCRGRGGLRDRRGAPPRRLHDRRRRAPEARAADRSTGSPDAPRHPLRPRQLRHRRRARRRRLRRRGANTLGHIVQACAEGRADKDRKGRLRVPNLDALGLGAAPRRLRHELPRGFAEEPQGPLGRRPRGQQGQGHAVRPLGDRRRAGAVRVGLFPADRPDLPAGADRRADRTRRPARHPRQQARLGHADHRRARRGVDPRPASRSATPRSTACFQIAAHEEHFGLERLYEVCRTPSSSTTR